MLSPSFPPMGTYFYGFISRAIYCLPGNYSHLFLTSSCSVLAIVGRCWAQCRGYGRHPTTPSPGNNLLIWNRPSLAPWGRKRHLRCIQGWKCGPISEVPQNSRELTVTGMLSSLFILHRSTPSLLPPGVISGSLFFTQPFGLRNYQSIFYSFLPCQNPPTTPLVSAFDWICAIRVSCVLVNTNSSSHTQQTLQ